MQYISVSLNKGALCKQCFNKKIKPAIANEKVNETNNFENKNDSLDDINYDPTNDRSIMDIIKEYDKRMEVE